MGKRLIIAEKPSVAGDIAKALGGFDKSFGDVIVASARGHLVELYCPEAEKGGKTLEDLPVIPARFSVRPIKEARAQLESLTALMNDTRVTEIINACDAGREGELIFRLIYQYAKCRKPIQRMWLQSMTQEAIRSSWKNLRSGADFDALADAAYCRSEADWIIGINGTRGLSQLHSRQNGHYELMSVGRVQTPTLSMVVEREQAIKNFLPKDFWIVRATFGVAAGSYQATWFDETQPRPTNSDLTDEDHLADGGEHQDDVSLPAQSNGQRIFDKRRADALVIKCQGVRPGPVTEQATQVRQPPPRLLDLTTLQRLANTQLKFSAKKTLDIAQRLYEIHKATTYPRTDSMALPEDYIPTAQRLMTALAGGSPYAGLANTVLQGGWVKPNKRIFDDSQITDHFAIIPTETVPTNLTADERCIYDLIVRRFIGTFYPDAVQQITTRITTVANEKFRSTGCVQIDAGWRVVWDEKHSQNEQPQLCAYRAGETVRNEGVCTVGGKTKPPLRYTEATLLAAMAKAGKTIVNAQLRQAIRDCGLGTPATRAAIIEILLSTGSKERPRQPYMLRQGPEQYLAPTDKGQELYTFLTSSELSVLTSAELTATWEARLQDVQKNLLGRSQFMTAIAQTASSMIETLRAKAAMAPAEQQARHDAEQESFTGACCPQCAGELKGARRLVCQCGFGIWRSIAQRDLNTDELIELLTKRRTGLLKGFHSNKTHRDFDAILTLKDDGSVGFVFSGNANADAQDNTHREPIKYLEAPCPKCGGRIHQVAGDNPSYRCVARDFTLWATIAGRTFSQQEVEQLISKGSLPMLQGFLSAKQKPFSAGLRLAAQSGKVEFIFDNSGA